MAQHVHSYAGAAGNPVKFCHGFGIFQYDIQFCGNDPDFFLQRQWTDFSTCLSKALRELDNARTRAYGPNKDTLTDTEAVYVAIAYNQGHVDIHGSLKQGFKQDDGRFYGELMAGYLAMAQGVPLQ
jgi:hypothetical protein